jgi:hypothetical protein
MHEATRALHLAIIRAAKMVLAAWEAWLKSQ